MPTEYHNAFSFIERIVSIDNADSLEGYFTIPLGLGLFPQCLVAEAIGQLASWYAMKNNAFAYRPVAALVGATLFHSEAKPGEKIDIYVNVYNCDADRVCYSGQARCGGRLVVELRDCTGMMLPQTHFADAAAVEYQYKRLATVGARRNRLDVAADLAPTGIYVDNLNRIRGQLRIPFHADFFSDHFPRKPVFPATLLIQALYRMVIKYVSSVFIEYDARIIGIDEIKVRAWVYPGDELELMAEGVGNRSSAKLIRLSAYRSGKSIATAKMRIDYQDISNAS